MRKLLSILFTVTLVLGFASVSLAAIAGSPHDVNVMRAETDLEMCAMCHTPHSGTGMYPLWNRAQADQVYNMYNSPTFDQDLPAGTPIKESTNDHYASSHCLVCHNGVASTLVNYPAVYSVPDSRYDFDSSLLVAPWTNLGTNLMDDHPVAFTYDPAKDDIKDNNGFPSIYVNGGGRQFIDAPSGTKYPLYGDQFECATCHAVHDTATYTGKGSTQVFFLRSTNAASAMCRDCHTNR